MSAPARLKRPYRWVVLGVYALAAGITQMLWLNFAPLLGLVQQRYGVSELMASTLVLVFPLLYVFLSLPAGSLIDRRGYRFGVGVGIVATAAFSGLRLLDFSFWTLLAGQVGIALAQPYVVNGISKLVADWFDEEQGALATGLGTMGLFVGMAVGMAATPPLESALGLRGAMAVFFGIAVAVAVAFVVLVRPNEPGPAPAEASSPTSLADLLRHRGLLVCFACAFLGLGAFNGLTTWLEELLLPQGIDATTAGLVGGVLIVAGIFGSVVIPLLSDLSHRRKPFLLGCTLMAAACTWPLCTTGHVPTLMAMGALLGFFFMPAFALLLDMSAVLAGPRQVAGATSLLMMAGNFGGVLVILAVPVLKSLTGSTRGPAALLVLLPVLATLLVLAAPETGKPKTA